MNVEEQEELELFDSDVAVAVSVFSWGTLLTNLLMAYSLKYLWNMVSLLQFAVFM